MSTIEDLTAERERVRKDAAVRAESQTWYNSVTKVHERGTPPIGWTRGLNGAWSPPIPANTTINPTIDLIFNQTIKTTSTVTGLIRLSTTRELNGYQINWNFDYDGVGVGRMINNNNLVPEVIWIMTVTDYDNVRSNGFTTRKIEVRAIHSIKGMVQALKIVQIMPDYGNRSGDPPITRLRTNIL